MKFQVQGLDEIVLAAKEAMKISSSSGTYSPSSNNEETSSSETPKYSRAINNTFTSHVATLPFPLDRLASRIELTNSRYEFTLDITMYPQVKFPDSRLIGKSLPRHPVYVAQNTTYFLENGYPQWAIQNLAPTKKNKRTLKVFCGYGGTAMRKIETQKQDLFEAQIQEILDNTSIIVNNLTHQQHSQLNMYVTYKIEPTEIADE